MEQGHKKGVPAQAWHMIEKLVGICLPLFCKLFRIPLTEQTMVSILQFVKFGIIGVSNTLISYLIYAVTLLILEALHIQMRWDYVFANGVAFVLSVFWSYCWNSRLVFRAEDGEKRCWWKVLLRTYAAYAFTGVFLNNVISYVWIDVIHAPKMLAPVLYLIIGVPVNFILNKVWAYGKKG